MRILVTEELEFFCQSRIEVITQHDAGVGRQLADSNVGCISVW